MTDNPAAPSADEIAAAQAVLARLDAANKAAVAAQMPALKAFVDDERFAAVLLQASALRAALPTGTVVDLHLQAVEAGMTNLRNDLARLG